jgi:cell division protein FtsB
MKKGKSTMTQSLTQAHQQAPWRLQLQRIGLFLLGLVIVALVAGVYLNITAQTVSAGVEVQNLEWEKEKLQRRISNLRSDIGFLTSASVMEKRASELGYQPISPESTVFMVVSGYPGRQTVVMAPPPSPAAAEPPVLKPIYTQSLWEWLFQGMLDVSVSTREVLP